MLYIWIRLAILLVTFTFDIRRLIFLFFFLFSFFSSLNSISGQSFALVDLAWVVLCQWRYMSDALGEKKEADGSTFLFDY